MVCYFGHTLPDNCDETVTPFAYMDAMNLQQVRASHQLQCRDCPEVLGTCLHDDPPEGTHQGLVFQRLSMFDDEILYKPVCWCGWSSGWFSTLDMAEKVLDNHYLEPL